MAAFSWPGTPYTPTSARRLRVAPVRLARLCPQTVGLPVPEGGAGMLTVVLVRRLEAHGGQLATCRGVERVIVRGQAEGVRTTDGEV